MSARLGYGLRHPEVARVLAGTHAVVATYDERPAEDLHIRTTGFFGTVPLPDDFVVSIRCLVRVGDELVVCTNAHGSHPWPGGRREAGESYERTAIREVYEETGWHLDPVSIQPLGWLHLEHLIARPDDWSWPHPDWFQVVLSADATRRERDVWTDLDGGYEATSCLAPIDAALKMVADNSVAAAFIRAALETGTAAGN
ncbi:MAG TPA: NUDIX hydrolase [Acidimicrobiales bacterium]|nr:NUDIX hydrolase [Acidimicrobiales bacterium]